MTKESDPWQYRAACRKTDPDEFFAKSSDKWKYREVAEMCARCPVRQECLEANINSKFGYVGGTSPKERERLRGARQSGPIHDPDYIADLYLSGLGIVRTARVCGINREAVRIAIRERGLTREQWTSAEQMKGREREIRAHMERGRKAADIAKIMKLPAHEVRSVMGGGEQD